MQLRITLTFAFILIVFMMSAQIDKSAKVVLLQLKENGNYPNNGELPVLLYKQVFEFGNSNPTEVIENLFAQNNWGGSWRNGVYNFHHYHSTAHETLGVYAGWAEVQLGGDGSDIVRIEKGDLVILPAGTVHKRIDSGDGFAVVGAYPDKQRWDMNYGKKEELEKAGKNIKNVPIPTHDPVFGKNGSLFDYWK